MAVLLEELKNFNLDAGQMIDYVNYLDDTMRKVEKERKLQQ
jgi:hypothetical protein